MVSHTKNAILFRDEELDEVENKLYEIFADFCDVAQNARYREGKLPEAVLALGLANAVADMSRPEFIDSVVLNEIPSPELIDATNQPILDATKNSEPDRVLLIGDITINIFIDLPILPNPLIATLIVIIN